MEGLIDVKFTQICELLKRFSGKAYSSKLDEVDDEKIVDICIALWKLDYRCEIVDNKYGSLCATYPSKLIIPVYEIGVEGEVLHSSPLSDSVFVEARLTKKDEGSLKVNESSKGVQTKDSSNQTINCAHMGKTRRKRDSCKCKLHSKHSSRCASPSRDSSKCESPSRDSSNCESPSRDSSNCESPSRDSSNCVSPSRDSSNCVSPSRDSSNCESPSVDSSKCKSHSENSTNLKLIAKHCSSEAVSNVDEEHFLEKAFSLDASYPESSPAPPTFSSVVANSPVTKSPTSPRKRIQEIPEDTRCASGKLSNSPHPKFTLRECFNKANLARCRYRFPLPILLCKGKYVSRSATLSCLIDVIGKQFLHSADSPLEVEDELYPVPKHSNDLDRARFHDINLLDTIGTSSIIDLMVENKKVKYAFHVSSSEKADKENRYYKFSITSIPYPGCEFFREFTNRKFNSSKLFYDWDQSFNDASLSLAEETISSKVTSDWNNYKSWDLRKMTENYLKLIIRYVLDDESKETGFLVHCISGWDRTPLFISLIRLSLWADGLVHCSLDAKQMLYFTLAYDWYLFGHQLPDRLKSRENILYFCFEFLDEIYKESFMELTETRERHPSNGSCTSGAYDSATGGIETPLSSFGSATSLASSTSSNNLTAPQGPSAAPQALSGSSSVPTGGTHHKVSTPRPSEACSWPFSKENGFTFDGISDNESSRSRVNSLEASRGGGKSSAPSKASPSRSPLKEKNASSKAPAGVKGRKGKLNGFLRDFPGRKSQKASSEAPSVRFSTGSETLDSNLQGGFGAEVESPTGVYPPGGKGCSNPVPVPVPGGRSRHNSSSSSVGSWQFLSTSDPLKESFLIACEGHRSSRTSLTAEMVDSTHTIMEEATPSSSLESSQSIIVFNRKRRLSEVREMFFRVYSKEVSSLYPEASFLADIVQNIYQKLGN